MTPSSDENFWKAWHQLYLYNVPFPTDIIAHAALLCGSWESHLTNYIGCELTASNAPQDSILKHAALGFFEALRTYDLTAINQLYATILIRSEKLNRIQVDPKRRITPDWITWERKNDIGSPIS